MTRISFDEMKATIQKAFIRAGMPEDRADICARIHTESTADGVNSHGVNRVERFVEYLSNGWVDAQASPTLVNNLGALEIYNGNLGPGILNAIFAMNRAIQLADSNGVGWVSLQNTTHWMRGGTYGWLAAQKGYVGICWTNTERCMPPWGGKAEGIGNNPFVMAVPRKEGPLVLDMAMSQYSYGKVWGTRDKKQKLPYPGGFDQNGQLTDDPGIISETRRILPMGMWKGSGFAIMLDLISALSSGGLTTAGIDKVGKGSGGGSNQIFIAVNASRINTQEFIDHAINETIEQIKSSEPAKEKGEIYFPGEQSMKTRKENMELGIPIDDGVWAKIKELAYSAS